MSLYGISLIDISTQRAHNKFELCQEHPSALLNCRLLHKKNSWYNDRYCAWSKLLSKFEQKEIYRDLDSWIYWPSHNLQGLGGKIKKKANHDFLKDLWAFWVTKAAPSHLFKKLVKSSKIFWILCWVLDCAFQKLVKMSVECLKICFWKIELIGQFICFKQVVLELSPCSKSNLLINLLFGT